MSALASPSRDQHEDLAFAGRELAERGVLPERGREAGEIEDDFLEARPRRLVLEEDVVAGVQLDELGSRDAGGQEARFRNGADLVVAGMDDERRRLDRAEQAGGLDRRAGLEEPRRRLAGAGPAAQLVEPADPRFARAGDEAGREDLAEHRILLAPADPHQLEHGAVLAFAFRIAALRPAAGVAAVENQTRDPLRMARGVGRADRGAGRDPQQCEWLLDSRGLRHGVDVSEQAFEREILDLSVRQPAAAFVPAQESEVAAEEADPVPPDGALQLVLEMGQPVRRLDQDRAGADFGPGELHAVFRAQVADALTEFRIHGRCTGIV